MLLLEPFGMTPKPVRLSLARTVETQKDETLRPPVVSEVDRLMSGVLSEVNLVGGATEPNLGLPANPVQVVFLRGLPRLRPELTTEPADDGSDVMIPPAFIAGVEDICPRGETPRVVDGDGWESSALLDGFRCDAWAAGDDTNGEGFV